jgi:hypothetical protein
MYWPGSHCLHSAAVTAFTPSAHAQKDVAAIQALKAMSEYVAGQKSLSVTFDSDVEVITSDLQKLQFTSSGQVYGAPVAVVPAPVAPSCVQAVNPYGRVYMRCY